MNSIRRAPWFPCMVTLWGCAVMGCANWKPEHDSKSPLQKPRLASDTVVLEYRFVEVPSDYCPEETTDWPGVDEQHFPAELRRQLEANGLRCGVVGSQLPAWISGLFHQQEKTPEEMVSEESDGSMQRRSTTLYSRAGRPTKIVASPKPLAELIVLLHEDDILRGETYRGAQCVLELKTIPRGDGTVQLELLPTIEHGDAQQRFIGHEGNFIYDVSRARRKFEPLNIKGTLASGQALVVGCTAEPRGLGASFFADVSTHGLRRRLLVIRFSSSQLDDLFLTEDDRIPLVPDE